MEIRKIFKYIPTLVLLLAYVYQAAFAGGGGEPTTYNYSNTLGNTVTINTNGQGSYQIGTNDPVNFTTSARDGGGFYIDTANGRNTCFNGSCSGPDAHDLENFDNDIESNYKPSGNNKSANSSSSSSGEKYCSDNLLGICSDYLRKGDININDIPLMIVSIIQFLMGIAASVAVVALIYHAVRMQLASGITGDSSGVDKAKGGMKGSALGFVLAMSAWFLLTKLIEILSTNT